MVAGTWATTTARLFRLATSTAQACGTFLVTHGGITCYGAPDGTSWVGTGEPGDDSVQYGVNIDLLDQGADGEFGVLRFHNYSVDFLNDVLWEWNGSTMISLTQLK